MRFAWKTFLVTGASSGIGLALLLRLVEEGARAVAVARNEERLNAAIRDHEGAITALSCDLTQEPLVKAMAEQLRARNIVLDGAAHCAGSHRLRPLKLLDAEETSAMYASHVVSAVSLCRHLVGSRLLAPAGASLVLVSSAAALRGEAGTVAYSAAKGALISASRALAAELASRKVRVNVISPGVVLTPMGSDFLATLPPEKRARVEAGHPLGLGRPEDVAGAIAFLLSDDARWITGANLVIDGGLTLG